MINLNLVFDFLSYTGAPTNDPVDAIKLKNIIQDSSLASISRQQLQIPNLTVDQAITLPDPSSEYLVIATDNNISIKLDGSTTPILLNTIASGFKTLVFFNKGAITSLTVSNASGKTANVDLIIGNL